MENPPKNILDQVLDTILAKHYSNRTERTNVDRIRRFILFYYKRHPAEMGAPEVQAFSHQSCRRASCLR